MLRRNPVFALAIGVIALALHAFGGTREANADDGLPLPPGALARLGTLRWRHGDVISYVAFLPDGKTVLTAGQDNTVRLWERDTGKELRRFTIPQPAGPQAVQPGGGLRVFVNGVTRGQHSVALSRDGKTLAALLPNNVIQLWDTGSGKELRQLKGPPTGAGALLFAPDGKTLAARGGDRQIYLLDPATGKDVRPLKAPQPAAPNRFFIGAANAAGMAFAPDSKTIATSESVFNNGNVATHVKLISVESGAAIREIETAPQGVSAVTFSPSGKHLAYGNGNTIHLCDPETGKEIRAINAATGAMSLVFSPDNNTLAAKGRDQVIRLFAVDSGKEVGQLGEAAGGGAGNQVIIFGGGAGLQDAAFAPDGKVLAAGGGHALRFWEVASAKEIPMAGGHRGPVTALVITSDGNALASRGTDNVIRRWDAVTGKELDRFQAPAGTTTAAFSNDAKMVAFGNMDATIRMHEAASGKEIYRSKGHVNGIATLTFSQDGKMLASRGSFDQTIRLFDTAKGTLLREISLQAGNPVGAGGAMVWGGYGGAGGLALAFSPDGQTLAANISTVNPQGFPGGVPNVPGGANNQIRLWDVTTGKEIRQIPLAQAISVANIAFSPDGRVLALENVNQVVHLLEIASGKERGQLGKPAHVAAAGTVVNWMVVGRGFGGFAGNRPAASASVTFAPDGETLAVKGADHSVRVWDIVSLKEIGQFKGHDGAIASLAFAPNGKALASGSNDTTILVWDLTRLKREPKVKAADLNPKEVDSLWADLLGDDAAKAYQSVLKLGAAPGQAVPLFQQRLKPAAPVDVKKIDRWILDLDSGNYKTRTLAAAELEKLGELVVPALKKVLAAPKSVEIRRRVEPLLEKLTGGILSAEQVRVARAVEVLEKLDSVEARRILETLSRGAPGAFPTRQAQMSLGRLAHP